VQGSRSECNSTRLLGCLIPQAAFNCNHCCPSPALFIEPNRLTLNKPESESEAESVICYVVALIACVRSTFGNNCILSRFFSFILTSNKDHLSEPCHAAYVAYICYVFAFTLYERCR
jgi:hypothetical protein